MLFVCMWIIFHKHNSKLYFVTYSQYYREMSMVIVLPLQFAFVSLCKILLKYTVYTESSSHEYIERWNLTKCTCPYPALLPDMATHRVPQVLLQVSPLKGSVLTCDFLYWRVKEVHKGTQRQWVYLTFLCLPSSSQPWSVRFIPELGAVWVIPHTFSVHLSLYIIYWQWTYGLFPVLMNNMHMNISLCVSGAHKTHFCWVLPVPRTGFQEDIISFAESSVGLVLLDLSLSLDFFSKNCGFRVIFPWLVQFHMFTGDLDILFVFTVSILVFWPFYY